MNGRVLFVLTSPEYLRFFDDTIRLLAGAGREVHLVVNDAAEYKPVGLEGAGRLPLASVDVMPAARTFWADTAYAFRAVVDYLRFLHPDFAAAPLLRRRIREKVLPTAFHWLDRIRTLPSSVLSALLRCLSLCESAIPIDPRVLRKVRELSPDAIVVSPLVDAASPQVDWIKAARKLGIPSALSVASWDNLTNKGLMRVEPDRVFVWNAIQQAEAIRYHGSKAERVIVTGAPVFDRWFHAAPSQARDVFCATAGLPDARPFIVFTGSSPFIADAATEIAFVRRWIAALRASGDPNVRGVAVLVRPHPYNTAPWAAADVSALGPVTVWPRGPFNANDEGGRSVFFDTLHHASAVVGINTSAMIEAAIVGRPVLTITDFATQHGTLHFQYLLRQHGGPVLAADSLHQHVEQLAGALRDAVVFERFARPFVESFVRPNGIEQDAAPQLAAAIEQTASLPVKAHADGVEVLLRPAMLAFGVKTAVIERCAGPDPFAPMRKSIGHPVRVTRKHVARRIADGRGRLVRRARLFSNRGRRALHTVRAEVRNGSHLWKKCRRAMRQARYAVAMRMKGQDLRP